MTLTAKQTANTLIAICAWLCLGESMGHHVNIQSAGSDPGRALADAIPLVGLFFSVRWRVKLAGYTRTPGRQATALILVTCFGFGLLLVPIMLILGTGMFSIFSLCLFWGAGLCASIMWLKHLRRKDRPSETVATA
jgi:hypothetical protein